MMTRILKAIVPSVLAVLALGAFASAAGAQELGVLTAGPETEHETTYLTGEQVGSVEDNYFEVPGFGSFACENGLAEPTNAVVEGGTATEIAGSAINIEGCTAFGSFPVHVDATGCQAILTQATTLEEDEYTGKVDFTCEVGKHVDLTVTTFLGNCNFAVFPSGEPTGPEGEEHVVEELGGYVVYTVETGEPHDLKTDVHLEGLSWTLEPTAGICNEHNEGSNGLAEGTGTVTGFADEAHEFPNDLWISPEE